MTPSCSSLPPSSPLSSRTRPRAPYASASWQTRAYNLLFLLQDNLVVSLWVVASRLETATTPQLFSVFPTTLFFKRKIEYVLLRGASRPN